MLRDIVEDLQLKASESEEEIQRLKEECENYKSLSECLIEDKKKVELERNQLILDLENEKLSKN